MKNFEEEQVSVKLAQRLHQEDVVITDYPKLAVRIVYLDKKTWLPFGGVENLHLWRRLCQIWICFRIYEVASMNIRSFWLRHLYK